MLKNELNKLLKIDEIDAFYQETEVVMKIVKKK